MDNSLTLNWQPVKKEKSLELGLNTGALVAYHLHGVKLDGTQRTTQSHLCTH